MKNIFLKQKTFGFIGCGNITQAILRAIQQSETLLPSNIFVSNRSEEKLQKVKEEFLINVCKSNEELVNSCDVVFIATKPQDLTEAIEPIASSFRENQLVISLAAGYSLRNLSKLITNTPFIARVIVNSAAQVQQSVVGYDYTKPTEKYKNLIEELLAPLGIVLPIEEASLGAFTVGTSSGIGFVLELMTYWASWLSEHDIDQNLSHKMTMQTFLGASLLAQKYPEKNFNQLRDQVVSKKGVTAAGLKSIRELNVEKALRLSFEKAALRNQDLDQGL